MIVGNSMGAAKRASVISVKIEDANNARFDKFEQAWSIAMDDIIAKGRKGKATINYSGGKSSESPSSASLTSRRVLL